MIQIDLHYTGRKLPSLSPTQVTAIAKDASIAIATEIRKNFTRLGRASHSRYYWHEAADSVVLPGNQHDGIAEIKITQIGVRLHWRGGAVRPTGRVSEVTGKPTSSLLIPFSDSPLRKRRATLAEMGYDPEKVHVIKRRGGAPVLVYAAEKKRRTDLVYLGVLVKQATFHARPDVLPDDATLQAAAIRGAEQHINHMYKQQQQ